MDKTAIFIDFKNITNSEYKVDIFKIPLAIKNHIKERGTEQSVVRIYVFMSTPSNEHQNNFVDMMVQNGFDVSCLDYMDKAVDVIIASKLISDAHKNIYDIGVVVSGNISLYPAIREARNTGKRITIANFSDKISSIYKTTNYETGPMDFEILYLDTILEQIASKVNNTTINIDLIRDEVENEFFDGNLDYDKVNIRMYVTYWAIRARYLQACDEDNDLTKKMFDKLNDLSAQHQPGYIKALNKKWHPESWEQEIQMISKSW
jgi:uncharacterized LabA/DUF88 family protein